MLRMESRKSAETGTDQEERSEILKKVSNQGFCDDYSGIRINALGERFMVRRATVFNLSDQGDRYGQAAVFNLDDIEML
tara:strand:- start:178 stop:414 length:237 start_codon:yes stop_codon:yes gene_type:complete